MLADSIESTQFRKPAAVIILFISTMIVGSVANYTINRVLKITGLKMTDRILGSVFGLARGVLVVGSMLSYAPELFPVVKSHSAWEDSVAVPQVMMLREWVIGVMPTGEA